MIEGWMVNVATLLVAMVASYAVIKYKVDTLFKELNSIRNDIKDHDAFHIKHHDDMSMRIDTCFKSLNEVSNSVIVLERDTSYHLDMNQAEVKFITKEELNLHMENINSELANLNKNGDIMLKKLEDLTKSLS